MRRSNVNLAPLVVALASLMCIAFVPLASFAQSETVDYAQYEVLDVQEFDLLAAPGRSAAHLSPDGTRFVHIQDEDVCVYRLVDTVWARAYCFAVDWRAIAGPEEMFFSPDGRYLTLPTIDDGLIHFRDTDIRILDVETGRIIDLTEDGSDGSLSRDGSGGFLDLAPRWIDDDTLAFIRYTDLRRNGEALGLYRIDLPADGAIPEPQRIIEIPLMDVVPTYIMGSDPLRGRLAFNYDLRSLRSDLPLQGIWRVDVDGSDLRLVQPIRNPQALPWHIEHSADGNYLLIFLRDGISVVAIEDGEQIDIDPRFAAPPEDNSAANPPQFVLGAGWSPSGAALVYVVRDIVTPENSGLYIAPAPGEPGRLILQGDYYGTTCCMRKAIAWAPNDVILIGRGQAPGVLLVRVGVP